MSALILILITFSVGCSHAVMARKAQWSESKVHAKLAAADAYTTLWKDGSTWHVDQDELTCGMIWLNQTSYARSTYRISGIANTASCAEDEVVRSSCIASRVLWRRNELAFLNSFTYEADAVDWVGVDICSVAALTAL